MAHSLQVIQTKKKSPESANGRRKAKLFDAAPLLVDDKGNSLLVFFLFITCTSCGLGKKE